MRTKMRIERMRPLIIGHEMDNLTGLVEIDCAAWMTAYPELTRYTMAVTLPEGEPYFTPAEMEGTILRWIVRREDTAKAGEGSYQIIGTGENGEQKSTNFYPLYIYGNMPGLDGASDTPPEAALAWVSKVLDAAERAEEAAERAEGVAAGSVPVATLDKAGVVKPGNGLEVEKDGTLNVVGGGGSGGILQETDPTVPEWAKQPNKPTYTAEEVGAQPKGDYALKAEIPSVPVQSVNGKTGAVQLVAEDVGAADAKETAKAIDELYEEIADLKENGTGGSGTAVQPDWNQNDETAADYVKNRTHWVERPYDPIVWDGSTEGRDNIDLSPTYGQPAGTVVAYKISDHVLAKEELVVATIDVPAYQYEQSCNCSEPVDIVADTIWYMQYFIGDNDGGSIGSGNVVCTTVAGDFTSSMGVIIPSVGTYCVQFTPGAIRITGDVYHTIDAKYLPDTYATKEYVQTLITGAIGGSY